MRAPACREVTLRGNGGAVRNAIVTARTIGPDELPGGGIAPAEGSRGGLLLMVTDVTDLKVPRRRSARKSRCSAASTNRR